MDDIIIYSSFVYLALLIFFRKIFKISFYIAILVIIYIILSINFFYTQKEDLYNHAAHWAPVLMLLFALYVNLLFLCFIFSFIDLVIFFVRKRKKK